MLSSRIPHTRLAALGALAAATLMLSACGGSTTTVTSSTPGTTSSTATTTTPTSSTTSTASTTTTSSSGGTDTGAIQEQFDTALRKNLIETQGLSPAVADCVINKLHSTLSEADLQAVASGQVPKSVTQAAFNAGASCANAG